jgi:signal transduction histidine kinase
MIGTRGEEYEQAWRLERALILVRTLGVVLGFYLVSQTNTGDANIFPRASQLRIDIGYGIMAALAIANFVIWRMTGQARTAESLKRIGAGAFAIDAAVLLGLAWLYSYDPRGNTWVVIYILPLEGAIRYQLEGALGAVGITFFSEVAREIYLDATIPRYYFQVSNVAFRVGIQALIALVAGFMARSLAHEAENAAEQAKRFQEAARRESMARRELAAFNTAILTGVAAEDLDSSIQLMAGAVGRDLDFETFTIMLCEGDQLVVKGMHGLPFYEERVPLGSGVTGTVAATGKALIVPEVKRFPGYITVDAEIRSEMAAPLRIGDEVIGVVDVESRRANAFDESSLGVLRRLGDQVALVVHSARLHARQRETLERLRELDQMKSDFVAIASHELRTPLTAIHGYVRTLVRRFDQLSPEEVQHFLETISRQSDRMTRLVEDLLFLSKIEAGALRVHTEEADLRAYLEGTLESLGPDERSRVSLDIGEANGSVRLDTDKVAQILRNLIGNALKFSSPDTPVDLRARITDGHVELVVADQGVGISPEELPHIFDRFHQAGLVFTRAAEGAGLGLYITKRLVEALGGTIEVASAPGEGSTFTVRLPQSEAPFESAGDGEAAAVATAPSSIRR